MNGQATSALSAASTPQDTTRTAQATSQSRDRLDEEATVDETTRLLPSHHSRRAHATALAWSASAAVPDIVPSRKENGNRIIWKCPVATALVTAAITCLVVLLALRSFHGGRTSWLSRQQGYKPTTKSSNDGTLSDMMFDYIIVGAGPAGIITAVSLARLLPNATVLLLEAGTTSQASVLHNIQLQQNMRLQQQHESLAGKSSTSSRRSKTQTCQTTTAGPDMTSTTSSTSSNSLNEFDVPLLWSGVAASSGGALLESKGGSNNGGLLSNARNQRNRHGAASMLSSSSPLLLHSPSADHHWPIGRTLLGKNIGGSGIHNAMIYIRSLSTDWNSWNITGWDFYRDILPAYQELEQYQQVLDNRGRTSSTDDGKIDASTTTIASNATTAAAAAAAAASSHNRGRHGPIQTTPVDMNRVDAIAPLFVESAIQAGIPSKVPTGFNVDYGMNELTRNDVHLIHHPRIGVGYYEFNIRHGIRDSVARAFLGDSGNDDGGGDVMIPDNLWIESGVTVTRVLLEHEDTSNDSMIEPKNGATRTASSLQSRPSSVPLPSSSPLHNPKPRVIGVEYVRPVLMEDDVTYQRRDERVGQLWLRGRTSSSLRRVGEVILSAGAIMTPQILINSGIGGDDEHQDGDAETIAHQERKGPSKNTTHAILSVPKVKVHLPGVGKNLQDHPVVTMGFELDAEVALMGSVSSIYTIGSEMDEYFWSAMELNRLQTLNQSMYRSSANSKSSDEAQQSAILADLTLQLGTLGTPGFSAGCFLRSPYSDNDDSTPDIQITVFPRHMEPHVTRQTQQGTRDYLRLLRNKAMLVTVALLKPEARFEVKASMSSIPLVRFDGRDDVDSSCDQDSDETWKRILGYRLPEIDLPIGQKRYLTERDVQRLAWGLEQVRRIQAQPPLANHVGPEIYPGANVRGKELREYVRSKSLPNAHWAGSNRMSANTEDAMAVVDETLRVRNVRGLRIVDAGVLPTVPNGNLHSTVCVIAHRAATLIAAQAHEPTVS